MRMPVTACEEPVGWFVKSLFETVLKIFLFLHNLIKSFYFGSGRVIKNFFILFVYIIAVFRPDCVWGEGPKEKSRENLLKL